MTQDGFARKRNIIEHLFLSRKKTLFELHLFQAILPLLKSYILKFESKEPMIHKLHGNHIKLLKKFFSCFLKPEHAPSTSSDLVQLEITDSIIMSFNLFFIGAKTASILSEWRHTLTTELVAKVKEAFVSCGKYLQKKMPVDNVILKSASSVDPLAKGHSLSLTYISKIDLLLPTADAKEERDAFQLEMRAELPCG